MSDLNEWIKERRRIHDAATEGPWKQDEEDGVRGVDLYTNAEDEEFEDRWERQDADIRTWDADDATAIVDAHNNLLALLTAAEKVLEQVEFMETDAENYLNAGYLHASEVLLENAGDLRQAIEGAIK